MKTFKDYLLEAVKVTGNYVAIKAENMSDFLSKFDIVPKSGDAPPNNDYHCTLIYSKNTNQDPNLVLSQTSMGPDTKWSARVIGVECFDSIPKNGSRDSSKSCVVLKLECPAAVDAHKRLRFIGLKHSYAEYNAHVTLLYNVSAEEAHKIRDEINGRIMGMPAITMELFDVYSQKIDENYV